MRPIFYPNDFIQIKDRGTRKHNFTDEFIDFVKKDEITDRQSTRSKKSGGTNHYRPYL